MIGRVIGCGLLVMLLAACDAFGGNQGPPPLLQTTLTIHYNDSSVVFQNTGDNRMADPARLDFVRGGRGADGDDYPGSRMTSGALTPGECYTLVRRDSQPLIITDCTATNGTEIMTNITGLFWKAEPVQAENFTVYWDDTIVTQCPTYSIADTGTMQCSFVYPPNVSGAS